MIVFFFLKQKIATKTREEKKTKKKNTGSKGREETNDLQVKHELNEGGVVDQAVLVGVGLLDHLLQLLLGELLAEVCHNVPQLSHREEALAVLVKHLEGLPHLLIRWVGFQGTGGVLGELVKGQGRTSLSGELFQLSLSGVQAKRAHHKAKIFGLNGALALLVVVAEALEVTGLLLLIKRLKKLKKKEIE